MMNEEMKQESENTNSFVIHSTLGHTKAQLERGIQINDDCSFAQWSNADDFVDFRAEHFHTFSCYINGGYTIAQYKNNKRLTGGGPARTFIAPQGQESQWEINDKIQFIHLYFSQNQLNRICEQIFDKQPVRSLTEISFAPDEWLHTLLSQHIMPLDWSEKANTTALSYLSETVLTHMARKHLGIAMKSQRMSGLAPNTQNRIIEYIEENLAHELSIQTLADIAGLSTYHFARNFHHSIGQTPHQFVTERRLQKSYKLVRFSQDKLMYIGIQCGFSDQSHFTRLFKKRFNVTPHAMRKM